MTDRQQRYKTLAKATTLLCLAVQAMLFATVHPALAQNANGALWVMTYNNEGTDYLQVLTATNATQF